MERITLLRESVAAINCGIPLPPAYLKYFLSIKTINAKKIGAVRKIKYS